MSSDAGHPRYAVLISGRGSNLRAILDAELDATCVGVLSSRSGAPGLTVAAAAGLPTAVVLAGEHPQREAYDAAVAETLDAWGADWIVLAGFMRILSTGFLRRYAGRVVNIHPSLLPAFPGLRPQQQALDAGVREAGCTVHLVVPGEVDGGPILAQARVPVLPGDDERSLSERILAQEHALYPATLARLFAGRFDDDAPRPGAVGST